MAFGHGGQQSVSAPMLRLNQLLVEAGGAPLEDDMGPRFGRYLELLMLWNARMNLSAVRDEESILRRHFLESILCARVLPKGIKTLLDFGSGAGFPGLPIAICRPEIAVTLAESQSKKAAFLREAVRVVGVPAVVYGRRAELLKGHFGCVTLRAVDRMSQAVALSGELVERGGWLAVMTTQDEIDAVCRSAASCGTKFLWEPQLGLPSGTSQVLLLGHRPNLD